MTTTDTTALTRRSLLAAGGALCATCAAGCATYGTQTAAPSSAPAPAQAPPAAAPGSQQPRPVSPPSRTSRSAAARCSPTRASSSPSRSRGRSPPFDVTCPHQGCQVNEVVDGSISCPCHGSKFGVADGAPTTGPATSPLGPKQVSVQNDRIVLA